MLDDFCRLRRRHSPLGKVDCWNRLRLPRKFVNNIGWQQTGTGYVGHVGRLQRKEFRESLTRYREERPAGYKEHRRVTDAAASSISPQKLHGVPVALMFFEGAPRILAPPASVPLLKKGDGERVIVESYPGVLARALIGRRSYKNDAKAKQTSALYAARQGVLRRLVEMAPRIYGFSLEAPDVTGEDPTGDRLDALLCGVQAAWAWPQREQNFGLPQDVDPLEGWIADPHVRS